MGSNVVQTSFISFFTINIVFGIKGPLLCRSAERTLQGSTTYKQTEIEIQ